MDNTEYIIKIILLGDSGSGKTSLVRRITEDTFSKKHKKSEYNANKIIKHDEKNIKLKFYDASQYDKNLALNKMNIKECNCALIIVDITSLENLKNLEYWIDQIKECADLKFIIVVGTKIDIDDKDTYSDSYELFCENYGQMNKYIIEYIKISSKTGQNIDTLINHIINMTDKYKKKEEKKSIIYNTFDFEKQDTISLIPHKRTCWEMFIRLFSCCK